MAVIIWPTNLPQRLLREGYSETAADPRMISQMSTGPDKIRRRTSSAPMPVQGAMHLDTWQKARLERFWIEETSDGSLPFVFPAQTRDGEYLLTEDGDIVLTGDGDPIIVTALWYCTFDRQPIQFTPVGVRFQASIYLKVMP
jgi:hypothetical protein